MFTINERQDIITKLNTMGDDLTTILTEVRKRYGNVHAWDNESIMDGIYELIKSLETTKEQIENLQCESDETEKSYEPEESPSTEDDIPF